MKSKKGSEGADMIIMSVVFIICILFGSIGMFAINQFEIQKDKEQEQVIHSTLYEYQLQHYLAQPIDSPRQQVFDALLRDVVQDSGRRQNQQIELRKKADLTDFINEYHSEYLPSNSCWELRVNNNKVVENRDTCLLRRELGIDRMDISVFSSIQNVELIIR